MDANELPSGSYDGTVGKHVDDAREEGVVGGVFLHAPHPVLVIVDHTYMKDIDADLGHIRMYDTYD